MTTITQTGTFAIDELEKTRDQYSSGLLGDVSAFDFDKATEILTDKQRVKLVPCRRCRRACVVTQFATPEKTECLTCRGKKREERKEEVRVDKAHTVDPAKLENLADALINDAFHTVPLCPFDPAHEVELKYICHNDNYGPRHLEGYTDKGLPRYHQETGETVTFQCNTCLTTISYSTANQMQMLRQNEPKLLHHPGPSTHERLLGVRQAA